MDHSLKRLIPLALVAAVLVLAPSASAAPAGTAFTYQGQLTFQGAAVSDTCDFQFSLWDASTSGNQVGITQSQTLGVNNGLFISLLDFGDSSWSGGEQRWLDISVRCPSGAGDYTTLTPRQEIAPAPYAIWAAHTPWSGITSMPAGFSDGTDNDTTYTAGSGLTLTGSEFAIDGTYTQRRVSGTCSPGSAVASVAQDGTVTCETFSLDEIGNPTTDKTFNLANRNVHWVFTNPAGGMHWEFTGAASGHLLEIMTTGGNQTSGTHLLHIESDDADALPLHIKTVSGAQSLLVEGGAVITGSTHYITGTTYINGIKDPDITGVTAGTGLGGGGTSDNVMIYADTSYLQQRVTGTCSSGSAVTGINSAGTVTCGGLLWFSAYSVLPGSGISTNIDVYISTVWDSITLGAFTQTFYVGTTNNASNYWTIRVKRGTDGTSLGSITTSASSPNTWGQASTSINASVTTANRWIAVSVEKTGSPGTLYLSSPALSFSR